MSEENPLAYGTLPPKELAQEAIDALFPPMRKWPPPRTLADNLPEGLSEHAPAVAALKLPPPVELFKQRQPDELEPAFGKLTRVGFGDLPYLGWVGERLARQYPHMPAAAWVGHLRMYMNSNQFFFMKSERAAVLARAAQNAFGVSYLEPLFVLHQDLGPEGGSVQGSQGEREAIQLVRAMRDWGRQRGLTEIRNLTECSDLPANAYVRWFGAARRDEVWARIK